MAIHLNRNNRYLSSMKTRMEIEIEIDMPEDIVKDERRFNLVKEGIVRSFSRGLYEQGVSFEIIRSNWSTAHHPS